MLIWIDHRQAMPNLTPSLVHDPLSSSLRLLSYNLRTLNLRLVADETLFWPTDCSTPLWLSLESVCIMFHIISPSGKYYFNGPEETDTTLSFHTTDTSYTPLTQNEADEMVDHEISGIDWDKNRIRA
jgi:hypothetical protein